MLQGNFSQIYDLTIYVCVKTVLHKKAVFSPPHYLVKSEEKMLVVFGPFTI